ncbi:MAG: UvrD-helicase domain-containing protein [Oscillospiraceae bacterium]|jgi:DNA helicase-2/ATP-dependent DNA helicase PcrA|nr:UvrD-helicase domain-containing protein [Oscillospiraceae bacterium]
MDSENTHKTKLINHYFPKMNTEQQIAIGSLRGPVLILAGAGSGKTTVIVNRIFNLIRYGIDLNAKAAPAAAETWAEFAQGEAGYDVLGSSATLGERAKPWNILAITFTNKAAQELKSRLTNLLGEDADNVNAGTFHWLCLKILRRHIEELGHASNFTIYDSDDSKRLLKHISKLQNVNEEMFGANSILAEIRRAKDHLLDVDAYQLATGDNHRKAVIAEIYRAYQNELRISNALDFDDVIMLAVQLLRGNQEITEQYRKQFRYIMVDEYQDTSYSQFVLIRLLAGEQNNLCVVGDDDQSIYRFRGADIDNILNFGKHFSGAKLIRLEQNYRSTKNILDAANAMITHNQLRQGKTLWTKNPQGQAIEIFTAENEHMEAAYVADEISKIVKNKGNYNNCTVLYRTNAQSNVLETVFNKKRLPYRIFGGLRFYDRKEIKDMLAYLCVIINRQDDVRLLRIINEPRRRIGEKTIMALRETKQSGAESLFAAIEAATDNPQLQGFVAMINELESELKNTDLPGFIDILLKKTGYKEMIKNQGFDGEGKLENINELKTNLMLYCNTSDNPSLENFLNDIAIYAEHNTLNSEEDCINLMTLHSAKGLEFENVFIIGLEDGIFPGNRALFDEKELEEERRLAYVGFTRAKEKLFLTFATRRTYLGKTSFNRPSRFLKEIPQKLCSYHTSEQPKPAAKPAVRNRDFWSTTKTSKAATRRPQFAGGEQVTHSKFGVGRIQKITSSGNDQLLEVLFEKVGLKKLMANHAGLVIVSQPPS